MLSCTDRVDRYEEVGESPVAVLTDLEFSSAADLTALPAPDGGTRAGHRSPVEALDLPVEALECNCSN